MFQNHDRFMMQCFDNAEGRIGSNCEDLFVISRLQCPAQNDTIKNLIYYES